MVRKVIPPPEPRASRLRAATTADAPFVRSLSGEVFQQFGEYDAFLPGYLEHPSVFTTIVEQEGSPAGFLMLALVLVEGPDAEHAAGETAAADDRRGEDMGARRSGTAGRSGDGAADAAVSDEPIPEGLDAEVLAIAVAPGCQGQGVGRRLLQHAIDLAQAWSHASGVRTIQLNVAETNHRAIAFFTKMGFLVVNPDDGVYPRGQRSLRLARPLR